MSIKKCPVCEKEFSIYSEEDYCWTFPKNSARKKFYCSYGCRQIVYKKWLAKKKRKDAEKLRKRTEEYEKRNSGSVRNDNNNCVDSRSETE